METPNGLHFLLTQNEFVVFHLILLDFCGCLIPCAVFWGGVLQNGWQVYGWLRHRAAGNRPGARPPGMPHVRIVLFQGVALRREPNDRKQVTRERFRQKRHRTVMNFEGSVPTVCQTAFVAPSANVIGNVKIGSGSSVWYGTTLRGKFSNNRFPASAFLEAAESYTSPNFTKTRLT
eukprot:2257090-Pyramimonas_sp.AAC.2